MDNSLVNAIFRNIESVSTAAVKALKSHTFTVKVDNLDKIEKTLKDGIKSADTINVKADIVKVSDFSPEVSVKNFPEFPKFPESFQVSNPVTEVSVSNLEENSPLLKKLISQQDEIMRAIRGLKLDVKIPEFPKIPTPIVNVQEREIELPESLDFRGTDPKEYVPVRLTDGEKFYEAVMSVSTGLKRSQTISNIDPLQIYQVSDIDDAGATKYYGFLDKDGNWYIMQKTTTAVRYFSGSGNYSTNWTGRAGLSYDYFSEIF